MESNREIWRSIDGYANYEVSSHGRVRNAETERILKPGICVHGYAYVNLCKKGTAKKHKVHQIVAREFLENPLRKPCVDHADCNKLNNNIANLRFATYAENNTNRSKKQNSTSSYKGVCFDKNRNKWIAHVGIIGVTKYLGRFQTEKDAAKAYNEAATHHFGEYAKLNEID